MKKLSWLACAGWMIAASAQGAPETATTNREIRLLDDFSALGRLGFFSNHDDEFQDDRYVSEGTVLLDFDLLSVGERWSLWSRFGLVVDLGKSIADNLPFSPKEMAYEISPFVEYRRGAHLARFGWNHACQHLIYKDHEEPWYMAAGSNAVPPDVYWNRIFLGAGRAEVRPEVFRETTFGPAPPRLLWYAEIGGYLQSFPGMDDDSLYGYNDWVADARADLKLRLLAGAKWALFATSLTQVLLDGEDEFFTREQLQLEAAFASRGYGSSIYAGWHAVDEHPRDSKEGMLEFGAAFYY